MADPEAQVTAKDGKKPVKNDKTGNADEEEPSPPPAAYSCCCCKCSFLCSWPGGCLGVSFGTDDDPADIIGDSAYAFFLIPNIWTKIGAFCIVAFQVYLFVVLYKDVKDEESTVTGTNRAIALSSSCFLLFLRVSPNLGKGIELFWKGGKVWIVYPWKRWIKSMSKNEEEQGVRVAGFHDSTNGLPYTKSICLSFSLMWVGLVEFSVAALSVWVGITTALNVSKSITQIITNVAVATFIENVDETMYSFLKYFSTPSWYKESQEKLKENYGGKPSLRGDEIETLKSQLQTLKVLHENSDVLQTIIDEAMAKAKQSLSQWTR